MPSGRAAEPAEAQAVLTELVSVRHATLPQREAGWMLAAGCGEFLVRSASAWLCAQAWGGEPSWHLEDDADLPCPIARDQWNPVPVGPLFWFTVKLSCKTVSTKKADRFLLIACVNFILHSCDSWPAAATEQLQQSRKFCLQKQLARHSVGGHHCLKDWGIGSWITVRQRTWDMSYQPAIGVPIWAPKRAF